MTHTGRSIDVIPHEPDLGSAGLLGRLPVNEIEEMGSVKLVQRIHRAPLGKRPLAGFGLHRHFSGEKQRKIVSFAMIISW